MQQTATISSPNLKALFTTIALLTLPPLFWAGNFIVGRSVSGVVPPLTLSFLRWVIASLVLLPFTWRILAKEWPLYRQHRRRILLASVTGICAFNSLIYVGLQSTTANNAMILNAFIPLLISLFGVLFLKLQLRVNQWLGMIISFMGVLAIVSHGSLQQLLSFSLNPGDIWVFSAMICWAVYTLTIKNMPAAINRYGLMSIQMMIGVVILLPFYLGELTTVGAPQWSYHAAFALAYVGIMPSVVAYLIYSTSVARLGPARAGQSINLLPVFGVVLSLLFLGESIHLYQLAGMALIFAGLFATTRSAGRD
ncbi:threonine/homoserine efflux transporter RhtA [Reinekea marinisedimentorum]|uniref:Threonine/homoserine efflux transporter RhtA n=2 Tax=Reinekea marinisedimentorum TaxID=230495 RepID=A0A4V2UIQ7_9GAMM|nr:threonine/homoserine efflux transporter RhtA [Reinekea marinisedimentorum]